jgi:hypothetical protein
MTDKAIEAAAKALWSVSALNLTGARNLDAEFNAMKEADRAPYFLKARAAIAAYEAALGPINPGPIADMVNENVRLRAQVERMREAFTDAIDTVDFWAAYASDYFKDKHDLEGDLARLRAARAAMEG